MDWKCHNDTEVTIVQLNTVRIQFKVLPSCLAKSSDSGPY